VGRLGYQHVLRETRFKLIRNAFYKLDHFARKQRSFKNRVKIVRSR
jgi:hypothetical protein